MEPATQNQTCGNRRMTFRNFASVPEAFRSVPLRGSAARYWCRDGPRHYSYNRHVIYSVHPNTMCVACRETSWEAVLYVGCGRQLKIDNLVGWGYQRSRHSMCAPQWLFWQRLHKCTSYSVRSQEMMLEVCMHWERKEK